MARAAAFRHGCTTFAVAYLGLIVVCWGTGSAFTGSTDAVGLSPLAFAVALGWLPALGIGVATHALSRDVGYREPAPTNRVRRLVTGLVVAEVLALAVLHFGYRVGDTPEVVRRRIAADARTLAPGEVTAYLERHQGSPLEQDAALAALLDHSVWARLGGTTGLHADDADAIDARTLDRLERTPSDGAARELLTRLARDRLRHASIAALLARWPGREIDVLNAAEREPARVLVDDGCLRPDDQQAIRTAAARAIAAAPRSARAWPRWLAWSEYHCLAPGRLAAVLDTCATAQPDADREACTSTALRELVRLPAATSLVDERDLERLALVTAALSSAGKPAQRRLGLSVELWLEQQRLAPGRAGSVLAVAERLEGETGPLAVHTLRWLLTPAVALRLAAPGGEIGDADLEALAAATEAAIAARRLRASEAERIRLWIASRRVVASTDPAR